jgi:NAD(P)-dependent dehydrogenase (short-subunit alcohol dehydrogenase family)
MQRRRSGATTTGFFGPGSPSWKVWASPTSLIGFQRSVVLEHFDPYLAAAVADSAGIYTDPRGRLDRTLAYFLTVALADGRTAIAVSDALMRVHAKAKGIEPITGSRYSANNPAAQLWIHLTGWHSVLKCYERYGPGPLSADEEKWYWAESRIAAELQTCKPSDVPGSRDEVRQYFADVRGGRRRRGDRPTVIMCRSLQNRRIGMVELAGKVALVTGGSRGMGAAIAQRLAELGSDVAITYARSKERADQVVDKIVGTGQRGLAIEADSADAGAVVAAVQRVVEEFGPLDILVNNAGIFPFGPIEDTSLEEIDQALDIHPRAAYLASQAAVRLMPDGGRIISIGSNLAERVPFSGVTLYAMSKSALIGFTKGLARDLGGRGITVNLVQPGSTDTDMNPADGESADHQRALSALGRYAEAAEIADTVAFLAGAGGRNITGTILTIDGGTNA